MLYAIIWAQIINVPIIYHDTRTKTIQVRKRKIKIGQIHNADDTESKLNWSALPCSQSQSRCDKHGTARNCDWGKPSVGVSLVFSSGAIESSRAGSRHNEDVKTTEENWEHTKRRRTQTTSLSTNCYAIGNSKGWSASYYIERQN